MKPVDIFCPQLLRVSSLRQNRITLWNTGNQHKLRLDVEVLRALLFAHLVPELPLACCVNLVRQPSANFYMRYSTAGVVYDTLWENYNKVTIDIMSLTEDSFTLRALYYRNSFISINKQGCVELLDLLNSLVPLKE